MCLIFNLKSQFQVLSSLLLHAYLSHIELQNVVEAPVHGQVAAAH
jgi:hypothetical protein